MIEEQDPPGLTLPLEWELRPSGRQLLVALLRHGRLSLAQAARVASPNNPNISVDALRSHVHYLRQDLIMALVARRIDIRNVRGWGYRLADLEDARKCVTEHGGSW